MTFALSSGDKLSPTWLRLVEHLEQRLDVLRKQNDGRLDEVQTARMRGRIAQLKELISLGADQPVVED